MSARITLATALRVLRQLRHDPRTIALLIFVPCMLITLLRLIYSDQPQTFDRIGGPMVGLFPLLSMFLVTSVTMLRERTTGTLERLMTMPLAKLDLLAGYAVAFALFAAVQATVVASVAFLFLGLDVAGSVPLVVVLAITNALLGMSLGLFTSAFARTESPGRHISSPPPPPRRRCSPALFRTRAHAPDAVAGVFLTSPVTYAFDPPAAVGGGRALGGRRLAAIALTLAADGPIAAGARRRATVAYGSGGSRSWWAGVKKLR